jgi:hypothetical protein
VLGGGRVIKTPSFAFDVTGHVVCKICRLVLISHCRSWGRIKHTRSWLSSDCAPSRATAFKLALRFSDLGITSGLGSCARRWPRSNVY